MRVLHLIPAAWEYFNEIRDRAFELVEEESKLGIDAEAVTLQYGRVTERTSSSVKAKAPSRKFQGMEKMEDVFASFGDYDVLHIHSPSLGILRSVIRYKKQFPEKPVLVTYYGLFSISDLFSVFISWYNAWYQPKLFRVADVVVSHVYEPVLKKVANVFYLTDSAHEVQLMPVVYYKALYSKLV